MLNRRLVVFTQGFPFGTGENFIEDEVKYWCKFDEILICPLAVSKEARLVLRPIGDKKVHLIDLKYTGLSTSKKIYKTVCVIFTKIFLEEICQMVKLGKLAVKNLWRLLSLTVNTSEQVDKLINLSIFKDDDYETYVYAYWLYEPALAGVMLKEKSFNCQLLVSRAHGFDLYEERSGGYIPYRNLFFTGLDRIYCVSQNGKNYLSHKYPQYINKFSLARLGTEDYGFLPYKNLVNKSMRIISCSNCVPVKCIDKIIDALVLADKEGLPIEWTHIGGGPLLNELKDTAEKCLQRTVKFDFLGTIAHQQLMEIYKNKQFDVFVNVSSSEGIPVSIMEAMSFGIPAIATNVGGTAELVIDNFNGKLLSKNFLTKDLYHILREIFHLNYDQRMKFRIAARSFWEDNFSAAKNYSGFVNDLLK